MTATCCGGQVDRLLLVALFSCLGRLHALVFNSEPIKLQFKMRLPIPKTNLSTDLDRLLEYTGALS
jgi:hypothetical protein